MAARHERVVVDIGTGSGSAVLRRAAREPETLFVAIDAHAAAMNDASRRAARPIRRGGRPNAIFVVAAAEALPGDLCGLADELTIALPWGSLLAAALDPCSESFTGLSKVLKASGELVLLISAQPRDHVADHGELDDGAARQLGQHYASAGFEVTLLRPATRADVDALSSGWGQRLGIPERRAAWLYRLRRDPAAPRRHAP